MRIKKSKAYLLLAFFVVFSSCEKDDKGYPNAGGLLPTNYVSILNNGFNPSNISLPAGNSITFLNGTSMEHHVVSDDNTTINSGIIQPQKSYYWKKDLDGTFPYRCVIHPTETGTITLTP
jgi:plastocyanin